MVGRSPDAGDYHTAIESAARDDDEVPVVFVETAVTVAELDSLQVPSDWAGRYAGDVVQVIPNYLNERVMIYAKDHLDELTHTATSGWR